MCIATKITIKYNLKESLLSIIRFFLNTNNRKTSITKQLGKMGRD